MTRRPRSPYVAARKCRGPCQRLLPLSAFDHDTEALDGRQAYCPECKADATRTARWLREYGLRPGRAQACLAIQDDRCPICRATIDFEVKRGRQRRLTIVVDHDHETGEVRGLVHSICNLSPPAGALQSRHWLRYCEDPPMRQAHGGVPLIAPKSGLGDAQLPLLYEVEA